MTEKFCETLVVPDFENKYYRIKPNKPDCTVIDTKRLVLDIIFGKECTQNAMPEEEKLGNIALEGKHAFILKYKREKNEMYYAGYILSFDQDEYGNIDIKHINGTKVRHISFRLASSFNVFSFFADLIEENFSKKGIYVSLTEFPTGLEGAGIGTRAYENYERFRMKLNSLNKKYNIQKKTA